MTLNSWQEAFCRAYAGGAKGALAARQAGYGAAGAASQASRMLHNPEVAEGIGEFHAKHAQLRAEAARQHLRRDGDGGRPATQVRWRRRHGGVAAAKSAR